MGSQARIRMAGHYAIRGLAAGSTTLLERFEFGACPDELIGDVGERYFIALETTAEQVVGAMRDGVLGAADSAEAR